MARITALPSKGGGNSLPAREKFWRTATPNGVAQGASGPPGGAGRSPLVPLVAVRYHHGPPLWRNDPLQESPKRSPLPRHSPSPEFAESREYPPLGCGVARMIALPGWWWDFREAGGTHPPYLQLRTPLPPCPVSPGPPLAVRQPGDGVQGAGHLRVAIGMSGCGRMGPVLYAPPAGSL
jgi:hypothetical protein